MVLDSVGLGSTEVVFVIFVCMFACVFIFL